MKGRTPLIFVCWMPSLSSIYIHIYIPISLINIYLVYVYIQDTHTHTYYHDWISSIYVYTSFHTFFVYVSEIYIYRSYTQIFVYLTSYNYSYLICIYIGHAHQHICIQNLLYILYICISFYVSYKCIPPLYIHIFTTHAHTYAYTYLRIFPIYCTYLSLLCIYIYIYIYRAHACSPRRWLWLSISWRLLEFERGFSMR